VLTALRRAWRWFADASPSTPTPPLPATYLREARDYTPRLHRDLFRLLDRIDDDRTRFDPADGVPVSQEDCYAEAYTAWLANAFVFDVVEAIDKGEWIELVDLLFEADIRAKWLAERYQHFTRKGA
jgi:hypothetical protein